MAERYLPPDDDSFKAEVLTQLSSIEKAIKEANAQSRQYEEQIAARLLEIESLISKGTHDKHRSILTRLDTIEKELRNLR